MFKFCKANGGWWLVCKTPEDLLEYKDKTDYKYGKALVEGCEHKDGKYNKIYETAVAKAKCKGYSILDGMIDLQHTVFYHQIKYMIEENCEIWINQSGGWNCGLSNVEATTYMNKLIFPNCKKEDIRITKFTTYSGGKHYYAKIGDIEICEYINGEKIIKWNTQEEAYNCALRYCEEIDD